MGMQEFLATHPVFTHREFAACWNRGRARSARTLESVLAYHRRKGRILRVRRGLYCAVPPGGTPEPQAVDAWLLAAKLAEDATLAYHTALEFHGRAYTVFTEIQYLASRAIRPLHFCSSRFRRVQFPRKLVASGKQGFGVIAADHAGVPVPVTSLERTLVDLLDRPDLGGGWEEVWRSLETVEFFDLELVVEYALLLQNATTAAKVGFFLEQHAQALMVEAPHLEPLRRQRPRKPHYMTRNRRQGRLVSNWNLVAPAELLERPWQEAP